MRMPGLAGPRFRLSCRALLAGVVLLCAASALAGRPTICEPGAPCGPGQEVLLRAPQCSEVGAVLCPSAAAAGGGRGIGSVTLAAAPVLGRLVGSAQLDRRQVILGAIDPDHDDDYEYRLPYGDGVSFPVIQSYGSKFSHRGAEYYTVDFGMDVGTPIYAARDGVVVLYQDSHEGACWRAECGRLANFVVLLHSDGTTGEYYHLQRGSVVVTLGQRVRRGQLIARSGNTGYSTVPHLHFGVYRTERDGSTQSLPVRFLTDGGLVETPRTGARYFNPGHH
jgi:murein DD-endopeptidase MepM/ murein hydrolase activator NlpD